MLLELEDDDLVAWKASLKETPYKNRMAIRVLDKVKRGFSFDRANPEAVKWVEEHATELIDQMTEATRDKVTKLVERAFEGQYDVHDLADLVEKLVGDEDRADTIARTETMTASNRGQQEAWSQAADQGLLLGTEVQEWLVTPDDRLCPICEALDGAQAPLGGTFSVEGVEEDGPPAHPRCRCTIVLVLP